MAIGPSSLPSDAPIQEDTTAEPPRDVKRKRPATAGLRELADFGPKDWLIVALGLGGLAVLVGAIAYVVRYAYENSDAWSLVYAAVVSLTTLVIGGEKKASGKLLAPIAVAAFALPAALWASVQGWSFWANLGMLGLIAGAVVSLFRQDSGSSTVRVGGGIVTAALGFMLFLAAFTSRFLQGFGFGGSKYSILTSGGFYQSLVEIAPIGPTLSVIFAALVLGVLADLKSGIRKTLEG